MKLVAIIWDKLKKILSRGYDYYENNYVTSVEETEENVFEAEVEGTELYTTPCRIIAKRTLPL